MPPGSNWGQAQDMLRRGQINDAQTLINQTLQQDRSLNGLMSAVGVMEQVNASGTALQPYRNQAMEMARSQIQSGARESLPYVAMAKFSLEDANDSEFRAATKSLVQQFPNDKHSHYFNGIRALKDEDWKTAEIELRKSRELGIPEEGVALWLKLAIDRQRWIWQYAYATMWVIIAWLGGLGVLFVLGKLFSSLTAKAAERIALQGTGGLSGTLRTAYRILINVAGLYYYLSLPVVVIVSIALPLAIGYGLLMVPVLNLWLVILVLIVGCGSIITALSGLRACFVRVDDENIGRQLSRDECPVLWEVTRAVAEKVGTRPIDDIWITPTAEVAVVERGGFLARLRDRGKRTLILGFGLLDGLTQRALCGILAHEYGHFHNRDTAGGDVALRVNLSMLNFAEAIQQRGKIRVWDVAVHFLRFYWRLFQRITFGASRLQEVLADRISVLIYGPKALREGLRHAIRRSLEFDYMASKSLTMTVRQEPAPASFYQLPERPEFVARGQLEAMIIELINRPTTEEDTHPSPKDRFLFAERLGIADVPGGEALVWEWINTRDALNRLMNDQLLRQVRMQAEAAMQINRLKIDFLTHVLTQNNEPSVYEARAEVYMEQGDTDRAIADLNQALKNSPDNHDVRFARALAHRTAKNYSKALYDLNALLAVATSDAQYDLYYLIGDCQSKQEQYASAEEAFGKAIQLDGESFGARVGRGHARAKMGQYQLALADLDHILERLPQCSDIYLARARVYRQLGQHEKALADLRSAIENDAGFNEAQSELAEVSRLLERPVGSAVASRPKAVTT